MQKVFRITVDISKKIPAPAFEVNTNDLKSVKLEITITNGQSLLDLTDVTPRINIRKPDNEVIFQDCEIVDAKAGKVQIVLENQAYLVPGTHTAEIACYKGNEITAITGTFSYKSIKGIMNDEAVESKSEFTAIDRKIEAARKLLEDIGENGVGVDEQARQEIEEVSARLADTPNDKMQLLTRLLAGQVTKIKLIGDSVTAGVQASGFNIPANGRIILTNSRFNDGGTGYARESSKDWNTFQSWANLFRKYINTQYPSIDFFNAGVGGISLKEVLASYKSQLITNEEDVLFIMLGLNDRNEYPLSTYEDNMRELIDYSKERSKLIILMSPPPTTSEFVNNDPNRGLAEGRYFGSREIDQVLRKLSKEYKLPFISHYIASSDYMSKTNTAYQGTSGISADYTHPNTIGYKVMWQTIQQELNFANDVTEWAGNSLTKSNYVAAADINNFSKLPVGTSLCTLLRAEAEPIGLPAAGTVTTIKPNASSGYEGWTVQYFSQYSTGRILFRGYNGTAWTSWTSTSGSQSVFFSNDGILDNNVSTILKGITLGFITNSQGSAGNFPLGKGGLVVTFKGTDANDPFLKQMFYPYYENRVFIRTYADNSTWGKWSIDRQLIIQTTGDRVTETTLLTDSSFSNETVVYDYIGANKTNFPEGKAGCLITHKPPSAYVGYGYQEYHVYGATTVYKRAWTGSAWTSWAKISAT